MSEFLGRKVAIGLAIEQNRGVAETTPDVILPVAETPTINPVVEKTIKENSGGTNFEGTGDRISKRKTEGEIAMLPSIDSLGYLFLGIFGKVVSTDLGNGVYKHSFDVEQEQLHPSFTLFRKDPVQNYRYAGGVIGGADIDIAGEKIAITTKWLAKFGEKIGDIAQGQAQEIDLEPQHTKIKIADTVAELDNAPEMTCTESFKISIDKGLIEKSCLGKIDVEAVDGIFKVDMEFDAVYKATQFSDDLAGDQKKVMRVIIEDNDIDLGGGVKPKVQFDLFNVKYQGENLDYPSDDLAKIAITGKGYLDLTTGKNITAEIINKTAEYTA